MPEPISPLPTDHVFVLQFQESHGRPERSRAGRVEHLATGKATRFTTTKDFWDFVDKILTEVARGRKAGTPTKNASQV